MAHVTLNEEDAFRQSLTMRRIVNNSQKILDKALAEDARSHVMGDFLSEPEQFQAALKSQAVKGPQGLVRHTARALDSLAYLAKAMHIDIDEVPTGGNRHARTSKDIRMYNRKSEDKNALRGSAEPETVLADEGARVGIFAVAKPPVPDRKIYDHTSVNRIPRECIPVTEVIDVTRPQVASALWIALLLKFWLMIGGYCKAGLLHLKAILPLAFCLFCTIMPFYCVYQISRDAMLLGSISGEGIMYWVDYFTAISSTVFARMTGNAPPLEVQQAKNQLLGISAIHCGLLSIILAIGLAASPLLPQIIRQVLIQAS